MDELVNAFLEANPGKGICNDCLPRELGLPHAAPIATHRVAHKPAFREEAGSVRGLQHRAHQLASYLP